MNDRGYLKELSNAYADYQQLKFGKNPDVGNTEETIWDAGGLYSWQSAAESLEILSSEVADAAAGTGARTVTVKGLDSNYELLSETVTLNDGFYAVALGVADLAEAAGDTVRAQQLRSFAQRL